MVHRPLVVVSTILSAIYMHYIKSYFAYDYEAVYSVCLSYRNTHTATYIYLDIHVLTLNLPEFIIEDPNRSFGQAT